ncbi:MAG: hypothetical protein AAF492_15565, partial [Verrucomicrobiota bacterium]
MSGESKDQTSRLLRGLKFIFCSRVLYALAIGGVLVHELHTTGKLIRPDLLLLLAWLVPSILIVFLVTRSAPDLGWLLRPSLSKAGVLLLALGLLTLFGSFTDHFWFFFENWKIKKNEQAPFTEMGLFQFVLLTALLAPFLIRPIKRKALCFLLLLVGFQIVCFEALITQTDGRALFRDDHSSFIFRLWEFTQCFPQLINYNPYWNAGSISHYPTSSGTGAIALPFFPVARLMNPLDIYTWLIAFIYIGLVPWIAVGSFRLLGAPRMTSYIGGLFALGVSRQFFLWVLHYGTAAANFSMMFLLPILASLYRILFLKKYEWWNGVILTISVFFLLLWPLGGVVMVTILATVLLNLRRLTGKSFLLLALCGAAFFGLYFKNIWVITNSSQTFRENIIEINEQEDPAERWVFNEEIFEDGRELLFEKVGSVHPLLLFLGIAGIFFLPSRNKKLWYGPVMVGLIVFAGWGRSYFPELQLRRMAIPLAIISVVPASFWMTRILCSHGPYMAFMRAGAVSLLVVGCLG